MTGPGPIRRIALRAVAPLLKRWYAWHNGRARSVRMNGLRMTVLPGVFHPRLFFSTRLLAKHISAIRTNGRTFLDLGTGSGHIALMAARAGAVVTASDVNPAAVACAERNAGDNGLQLTTVLSDQFDHLPGHFDVIAINPPYYDRDPSTPAEHAFFAGEGLRYFKRLFPALAARIEMGAEVFMVLSEDLDLGRIGAIARTSDLNLQPLRRATRWGETTTVFAVVPRMPKGDRTVPVDNRPSP